MRKVEISTGVFWVEVPEADLRILCGCPADAVKHLLRKGFIHTEERDGMAWETGPNAVLLSDVAIQNERFCNLSEFPVLQMLYRQGMLLPGHPNNTGARPLLLGVQDQVEAQLHYLFRGNYGLISVEELMAAGVPEAMARELMRVKLRFAFGTIRQPEELVETRALGRGPVEVRNKVFVERRGMNLFTFTYRGHSLDIDLNLPPNSAYEPAYQLPYQHLRREYFSVVHCGEGDGWDVHRPCMSSILTFQGRLYLIDTGPNLLHSLHALGVSINEIDGIFQTHVHDDHFCGLPVLMRADHRVRYFSAPLVRHSVVRKLDALSPLTRGRFEDYFEVHDLQLDRWNRVDGLEVRPVVSPHPVETTVLFFRALWDAGYRSYAHLADVASFDVLRRMVTSDPEAPGVTEQACERTIRTYLTHVDVKKVDVGGGLIHGCATDYRTDTSHRIVLSHTAAPLSEEEREIGSSAAFGAADVLIPADHDYTKGSAFRFLRAYHPTVPEYDLHLLLNNPVVTFSPGTLVVRRGVVNRDIFLALSGLLEFVVPELGICHTLAAGSLAGELSGVLGCPARGTYRSLSVVTAVRIPSRLYRAFLRRNRILESTRRLIGLRRFLEETWLFGERLSGPIKTSIALKMRPVSLEQGQTWSPTTPPSLFVLQDGEVHVSVAERRVEILRRGGFCGEEHIVPGAPDAFTAQALTPSTGYAIDAEVLRPVPIVQWKLQETLERRLKEAQLDAVAAAAGT